MGTIGLSIIKHHNTTSLGCPPHFSKARTLFGADRLQGAADWRILKEVVGFRDFRAVLGSGDNKKTGGIEKYAVKWPWLLVTAGFFYDDTFITVIGL